MATIVIILIIANQNSISPNNFAPNKLNKVSINTIDKTVIQWGKLGNQKLKYCPIAVKSDMLEIIQLIQYVHPITKPPKGPRKSLAMSTKELYCVLLSNNSPKARMKANNTMPIIIYANNMEGPVNEMVWPEPKKRPVPIALPMAINWI